MEDEIRNQSRIRLSTMVPVQLSPLPSSPPGRSPAPVRRLLPGSAICLRSTATSPVKMLGRVTRRRVLAGLNLTRRTAHSGLLESASRRLPTRTYPLQFQALSPNGHTIVEPCLNATSIPPSSFPAGYCPKGPPPPCPAVPLLTSSLGKRPGPSRSSPSRTRTGPRNWSSTVTPQMSTNSPPCQLSHPNPSFLFKGASDRGQSIPSAPCVSLL